MSALNMSTHTDHEWCFKPIILSIIKRQEVIGSWKWRFSPRRDRDPRFMVSEPEWAAQAEERSLLTEEPRAELSYQPELLQVYGPLLCGPFVSEQSKWRDSHRSGNTQNTRKYIKQLHQKPQDCWWCMWGTAFRKETVSGYPSAKGWETASYGIHSSEECVRYSV